jgi:hypothetical protein
MTVKASSTLFRYGGIRREHHHRGHWQGAAYLVDRVEQRSHQNASIVRPSIRVLTVLTVRDIAPDGSSIAIDTGTWVTTHMSFPLGS